MFLLLLSRLSCLSCFFFFFSGCRNNTRQTWNRNSTNSRVLKKRGSARIRENSRCLCLWIIVVGFDLNRIDIILFPHRSASELELAVQPGKTKHCSETLPGCRAQQIKFWKLDCHRKSQSVQDSILQDIREDLIEWDFTIELLKCRSDFFNGLPPSLLQSKG